MLSQFEIQKIISCKNWLEGTAERPLWTLGEPYRTPKENKYQLL